MRKNYLAGTFLGLSNGFHFATQPPPGIEDRRFLNSADAEEVLACVLANVQRGVFEVTDVLPRLIQTSSQPGTWLAATSLIGYAAPMRHVRWLIEHYGDAPNPFMQRDAFGAGVAAGSLAIVPQLLAAHASASDEDARNFFEQDLSFLIEDGYGPLAEGPDEIEISKEDWAPVGAYSTVFDFAGYQRIARLELQTIVDEFDEYVAFAEGEPIHVRRVAERLLRCIANGEPGYRIEHGKMLLEAFTGHDFRGFYDDRGILKPLTAAAIVEGLLADPRVDTFEIGKRYFFGHLIPS